MTVSKNTENGIFDCDFTYILIRAQLHGSSHLFLGVGMNFDNAANAMWVGGETFDSPHTIGAKAVVDL